MTSLALAVMKAKQNIVVTPTHLTIENLLKYSVVSIYRRCSRRRKDNCLYGEVVYVSASMDCTAKIDIQW